MYQKKQDRKRKSLKISTAYKQVTPSIERIKEERSKETSTTTREIFYDFRAKKKEIN